MLFAIRKKDIKSELDEEVEKMSTSDRVMIWQIQTHSISYFQGQMFIANM